jgi:predicted TIM-barrel fold metal-dependent hydrolase
VQVPVHIHTGPHSAASPAQLALLAARHPLASFILGHCGSTNYAYDIPVVIQADLRNIYYEASLARPWAVAAYAQHRQRPTLIFGSSAPRNDAAFELERLQQYLPLTEHPEIYGRNLAQLLKEQN